jgi:hypothetical protein
LFTDNHIVQDYAKTLKFKKLYTNESLHRSNKIDIPIMQVPNHDPYIDKREINIQVLSDLFLAALSDHIYPTYLQGYQGNLQFTNQKVKSGFINLAIELQSNKTLLQSVLG